MTALDDTRRALKEVVVTHCLRHAEDDKLVMALADAYALAMLHEAVLRMVGDPGWHKGHTAKTCPLAVELALREGLGEEK